MENRNEQKLGGGIMTISIISLVIYVLGLIGLLITVAMKDTFKEILANSGQNLELTTGQIVVSIILSLVLICGIILILCKKALGVYTYFTAIVVNIIYSITMDGFKLSSLIFALILPVLMGIFIYQKKEIFGFGASDSDINM